MTLHWPARLALILYLVLLALMAFNLSIVLELPLWSAAAPPALAAAALAGTWLTAGRRSALFACLLALGSIGLLAVALVLAVPAWQVIADGASRSWAGRMLPMFAAALALHACNLWVSAAAAGEHEERVERLARLIYGPGIIASLLTALILCASLVLGMEWLARSGADAQAITRRFLERGIIPPLTVLLFFWGMLLLLGKWWNGWYLRRAVARWSAGLTLLRPSPFTAGLDALTANAADLAEGLQMLWRRHEESWLLPRYLSWAVPVLGFIGTVLGISLAAEGIRRIIASDAGLASLSSDLDGAIAPLGIAFDTTLIALSLSVVLTLALALVQRGEERLLATLERRAREAAREA
ncbi:MAG: MotA/TolQ/ExbB proton channel family protein [Gammaproteobacteria bacterium]|nr:MotA/TolQ/ExbB proton channel family protein [Gammaproteobacteria bacterium]